VVLVLNIYQLDALPVAQPTASNTEEKVQAKYPKISDTPCFKHA